MRLAAILIAVSMAACGTPQPLKPWLKPGGNLAQDDAACKFEAEKGAVSSDPNAMMAAYERAERRNKLMDLCMRAKGWTR